MEKVRSEMVKRGKSGEMLVAGELSGRGYDVFTSLTEIFEIEYCKFY